MTVGVVLHLRSVVVWVLYAAVCTESATYFGHETDYPEPNLVSNPEFEEPLGGDWENAGGQGVIATEGCYSGQKCAAVAGRTAKWQGLRYHVSPSLMEPNRHYWISFFVKMLTDPASGDLFQAELLVKNVSAAATDYYGLVKTSSVKAHPDRWIYVGSHFTTPGAAELALIEEYVVYVSLPAEVDHMLDAVSVTRVYNPGWRAEAEANIRTYRQSAINLSGDIPSCYDPSLVSIEVNQTSRDFPIGAGLRVDLINDIPSEVSADYIARFREYYLARYKWTVFENAAKWRQMEWNKITDSSKFTKVDAALDYLDANGIKARGHAIGWNKAGTNPVWVESQNGSAFTAELERRADYFTDHYAGRFEHYDVSNEHGADDYYEVQTGNADILSDIYRRVRTDDPDTDLFTNNYNVLTRSSYTARACTNAMVLKNENLLDGIGLQSHFDFDLTNTIDDKPLIKRRMDIIRSVGLPMWVTELSVAALDMDQRADFLEDIMYIFLGTPEVEGILLWPYDTYRSYCETLNNAKAHCSLTEDLVNNGAGDRLDRLLFEDFQTNEIYFPNTPDFSYYLPGFYGEYTVSLRYDGQLQDATSFTLSKDHEVDITIDFMCPSIATVQQ